MFDKDLVYETGTIPGAGRYKCTKCGFEFDIKDGEALPICPKCGNNNFRRIA